MRSTALSIAFLALIAARSNAQEVAASDPNIRPAGDVVLKFERKIEIPEIKRFQDGVLELFPGDTVHLEFEEKNGDLVRPKIVAEVQYPKRTITFRMTQDESITMLFRESEIQKTVALDCEHRGLSSKEFSRTNLNPTEKGLMAGDSWSNSVWSLRLSNIEVTSKSASEVYKDKVSKNRPTSEDKSEQAAPSDGDKPAN
jgi:hypothetical protein